MQRSNAIFSHRLSRARTYLKIEMPLLPRAARLRTWRSLCIATTTRNYYSARISRRVILPLSYKLPPLFHENSIYHQLPFHISRRGRSRGQRIRFNRWLLRRLCCLLFISLAFILLFHALRFRLAEFRPYCSRRICVPKPSSCHALHTSFRRKSMPLIYISY